jgi:hypothetical protein
MVVLIKTLLPNWLTVVNVSARLGRRNWVVIRLKLWDQG